MATTETTTRPRSARSRSAVRTVFAGLALAGALIAVPAMHPQDASARRISERAASRACSQAGGHLHYIIGGDRYKDFDMICTLPSGASFVCVGLAGPMKRVDCY